MIKKVVKKKKILLLSDDLRMSSGVGTMSREFVYGTLHKYDWVQLGGAIKHPEEGKPADISEQVGKEVGAELTLASFNMLTLGEGIEKKEDNLADEVAKMTGGN